MEKQKCPKIRFNSFNDAWNSKQIENILKIKSGMSQKHIEVERGIYPILATGGEIGRTNTPIYDKESVLIGRKGTIDKPYYMNSPFWTVDTLFYSELSSDVAGFFVYSLFQRINWRHHNTSTGVPSLTSSVIHAIDVNIPDKVEQAQIGNFFKNLDQSIALQEKKLSQTQNLKKAMLEKMFPQMGSKRPEIRLKGFIGDWVESKLGDVYSFNYGKFNTNPSNGGQYPVYGANGIIGGYTDYNAESSAVIGHMGEYAGSVLWAEGKHFVTYNGTISKPKKSDFDSLFGYFMLVKMNLKKVCGGSGQPFLSYEVLERLNVLLPTLEEQTVIGQFFKQLDETLVLQQQQLQTLKNLKQAFLEKMFV